MRQPSPGVKGPRGKLSTAGPFSARQDIPVHEAPDLLASRDCIAVRGCRVRVRIAARALHRQRADRDQMFGWFGEDAPPAISSAPDPRRRWFSIGLFADELPGVRFLRPLRNGALLATTPRDGRVWRLSPDKSGDGRSDAAVPLLENLNRPHGLDLHEGWLYVAEGDGIGRVRIDADTGELEGSYERVVDGLPSGGNTGHAPVRFGTRRMM